MNRKFFSLGLVLAAMTAHAQTDTLKGGTYDEVVVTANKFAQKQSTTGKVVTVISKEQIEKSSGRTLPQLLNEQVGITINGAFNNIGTNSTVYMRGAREGRTLVLIDGMPATDPSFIQGEFDINLIALTNIERIEIARGAQSTLYGSDATAGVINIITVKKDVTKPFNVRAVASAGNFGTYRGNVQLYGKSGKLSYQTNYAKLKSNGFSTAYDTTGKGDYDNDGYYGDVVSASVGYQFLPSLQVRSFARYSRYKTDLDYDRFIDDKDYTNTNSAKMFGGTVSYQRNGVSVTGNYQYSENDRKYLNDSMDVPISAFGNYAVDQYFGKSQFAELYTNVEMGANVNLLTGTDYRFNVMNSQTYYAPFPATSFPDTSVSQSSAYASLFIHDNSRKLNVELGGRLNVHSRYGSNHTYTFNPSYSFNEHYRVFGSMATGYKAPTLYQLFDGFVGTDTLKPETSKTYEIGFQQAHNKISSRIVYFHRKITNGIDFDNAISYRYFNFFEQTVDGIEVEERIKPLTGLEITANYTYIKPKELTQSRLNTKDTTYSYLLKRPAHNLNLTVGYAYKGFYVSARGKYVSKRYDLGGYDPITFAALPDAALDSYFILGAYAEYTFKKYVKLFVDGQNISGKKFFDIRGYNSIPALVSGGVVFTW